MTESPREDEHTPTRATQADAARAGADLVRESLARAKSARRSQGGPQPRRARPTRANQGEHDEPVPFGASLKDLLAERGWTAHAAAAGVLTNWAALVGPDIAGHCRAVQLSEGELVVEAESTAWATQLRLLSRQILATLNERVGQQTVTRLTVRGPGGPSWKHGRLRVRGPGPRDTYG